jgi:hypothetical protein
MDAFSAQIVKFVREMPDEALLELVKQKLGVVQAAVRKGAQAARTSPTRAASAATPKAREKDSTRSDTVRPGAGPASGRPPPISADRQATLDKVEGVVRAGNGVSASEVAKAANIPQTRAAAALKELKLAKRIFQGGDRRFARYACDPKVAEQASAFARKTAKGPIVRAPRSTTRPRKRPAPASAIAS